MVLPVVQPAVWINPPGLAQRPAQLPRLALPARPVGDLVIAELLQPAVPRVLDRPEPQAREMPERLRVTDAQEFGEPVDLRQVAQLLVVLDPRHPYLDFLLTKRPGRAGPARLVEGLAVDGSLAR